MGIPELLLMGAVLRSLLWIGILTTAFLIVNQYIDDEDDHRVVLRVFQGFMVVLVLIITFHAVIQFLAIGD